MASMSSVTNHPTCNTNGSGNFSRTTDLPKSLKIEELVSLRSAIGHLVVKRDYRIEDQCQGIVAYRPFWGGRPDPSGGVDAELRHAQDTLMGMMVYHPPEDGNPEVLFRGVERARAYSSIAELITALETWQHDYEEGNKTTPETWESQFKT